MCFWKCSNAKCKFFRRIFNLVCPSVGSFKVNLPNQWIQQDLDHFDNSETRTWQMRYLANNEYFKNGGPMFVLIGGEWEISESDLHCGHFHDIAKEHKGYLFYTEHRYYGKSNPTDGLAMANVKDEFKYLNAKQAIADLEHFIRTIKKTTPGLTNSKVIIAGGSYAGSLAVWLKKLYPDLVDGGWASSAPLLAKLDFSEANAVVVQTYRLLGGDDCYNRIQNGIAQLEIMLNSGQIADAKNLFRISGDFNENNPLDKQSLFDAVLIGFTEYVRYQKKNDVQMVCERIMNGEEDVTSVANFLLRNIPYDTYFSLSYKETIRALSNNKLYKDNYRFFYQQCNELGWFWTSEYESFGILIPSSFHMRKCAELFGEEFTEDYIKNKIAETNQIFGGLSSNVQNIYMTHGEYDPWRFLGLEVEATIIPRASHCSDLSSISSDDSKEMKASKKQLAEKVREWVRQ